MNKGRIDALARCLDALIREQEADGFENFWIMGRDKVSFAEAREIVAALFDRANGQSMTEPK